MQLIHASYLPPAFQPNGRPTALVGLSAGVDSSAAAILLREQGYDVYGATMLLWQDGDMRAKHRLLAEKAEAIARQLQIPWVGLDLAEAFYAEVVSPFMSAYRQGETPNPCVFCNRSFKFGRFPRQAEAAFQALLQQPDFRLAHWSTGHYASLRPLPGGGQGLYRAADLKKDQSYMLWSLQAEEIDRLLLPLGEHNKAEARALCAAHGIVIPPSEESQEICFVAGSYKDFLAAREGGDFGRKGYFKNTAGEILGEHEGVARFTVGQRKKLGQSFGQRVVVLEIHGDSGDVIIGDESELFQREVALRDVNFTLHHAPQLPLDLGVSIRYQKPPAAARLELAADGYRLHFAEGQRAPTPGQSAVFYRDDRLVGGGYIRPLRRF